MGQITICDGQTILAPTTTNSKENVESPWGIPTDPEKLVRFARIFAGVRDGERDFNQARDKYNRERFNSAR